jgi:predicted O-methyltransferase YrrM
MVGSFGEALRAVEKVDGWMTDQQARRLWDRASGLRPGDQIVEIGSFRGRSTVILASAAPEGVDLFAIDPHAGNDRGPQEIEGYSEAAAVDHDVFHENLRTAGVDDRVRHLRAFSLDALGAVEGDVELLYIDGAHRVEPALADIRVWGGRVAPGGTMLIHDSFSSVGVTLAILRALALGRRFRYAGRSGSMTEYRRQLVAGGGRFRNALAQLAQLPWFVKNLGLKVLIITRLKKGPWPY